MESYHFVGIITVIAVSVYWFVILHQIDRIEDKINKLLKAQTEPKKPKNLRTHSYDGYIGNCPSCDRVVRFAQKHCHNCTQLLDWIEVKNLPVDDDDMT